MDKCLGRNIVPDASRAAGLKIEVHHDHFEQDAPDTHWISEVGKRKWCILTKDREITRHYLEVAALLKAGVPSFVLRSGGTTGEENAASLLRAMQQMIELSLRMQPPFVAFVSKSGEVNLRFTQHGLAEKSLPDPE